MGTTAYLCQRCASQDFLSQEAWRKGAVAPMEISLGMLGELRSQPDCPFCRLKLSAMTEGIRVFEHLEASWHYSLRGFTVGPAGTRIVFLEEDSPAWLPKVGKVIGEEQINTELVQKWIYLCESHHGKQCAPLPLRTGNAGDGNGNMRFRVIDVVSKCIVDASLGCEYLALSYVWGQTIQVRLLKSNKGSLMAPGGLNSVYQHLPNTIKDAILLVSLIGKRYLWVDSLCLVQDDETDMIDGIGSMDLVYGAATATIIAASGTDAEYGLPGVRSGSRHAQQNIEEVAPRIRMMVLRDIDHYLKVSAYSTRGWTYVPRYPLCLLSRCADCLRFQEQMLSRRSIIFINNRVYFRCRRCVWGEDNNDDTRPDTDNQVEELLGSLIPLALDPDEPALSAYQMLLLYYSERQLTKDSDAINAFAGMLRFLSSRMESRVLEGLPTASFDLSLLFRGTGLRRRPEFPSYSWAGWAGRVQWPLERDWHWPEEESIQRGDTININEWLDTKTWISWYERNPNGDLQSLVTPTASEERVLLNHVSYNNRRHPFLSAYLPRTPSNCTNPLHTYPFLQFWTYTVQLSLLIPTEENWRALEVADRRGRICGHVVLNNGDLIQITAPVEFLILSECRQTIINEWARFSGPLWQPEDKETYGLLSDWDFYWVMLITWEHGVAERRGIGTIHKRSLDWSYPPGKMWKEIILG